MDLRFRHPFTCMVAGPTQAGKTEFVKKFIENSHTMVNPSPEQIYYAYSEWQPAYHQLSKDPRVVMTEGLPDLDLLRSNPKTPKLLILDDLMQEMKSDKRLAQIFTRGCHHWSLSCIHIVQNMFFDGLRTSRINAQYLVLMKNPGDKLQAVNLGKQLFPKRLQYFLDSYQDATSKPYGYLLIDVSPLTEEQARLRTKIFPNELQIVYCSKV